MPIPTSAVILAAGKGIRLGNMGTLMPKGMIRLGERPLVEESILRLRRAGIRDIVVVTGHLREQLAPVAQRYAGLVRLVHNERYATGGSLSSLARALAEAHGDFLLLESDLVYESRVLSALLAQPQGSVVLVSGETRAGDEVWVETTGAAAGHGLVAMSKDRRRLGAQVLGELTGLTRVAGDDSSELARCMASLGGAGDYEDALVALARVKTVRVHREDGLLWAEIDTPEMLERVRRDVYPAITRADAPVPPSPQ